MWVPPGCYERGSSPFEDWLASADETPRHSACISRGFWLDRTEVTNEDFDAFVRSGWYQDRSRWSDAGWASLRGASRLHWPADLHKMSHGFRIATPE